MAGGARRIGWAALLLAAASPALAGPAIARDTLGVYRGWAAFRDPERCYAIAQPRRALKEAGQGTGRTGQPFATVATWPGRQLRASLHVRLSRAVQPDQPVTLTVGDRRFRLDARGTDAFATDAASDRALVAALRAGRSMSVEAVGMGGRPFADTYALPGAATAIDAATLACAALR